MSTMALVVQADWRVFAACRGCDIEAFFPKGGAATYVKRICRDCPVSLQCLDEAMGRDVGEDFGVWGGLTQLERRRLRKASA